MNRRITGLVAVIFLASGTPKAFAQSGSDRTSTEEAERFPPGRKPGTGGAGRKLPGELSAAEETRLLEDAERIVRSAELVVDGEPDRILMPSPPTARAAMSSRATMRAFSRRRTARGGR